MPYLDVPCTFLHRLVEIPELSLEFLSPSLLDLGFGQTHTSAFQFGLPLPEAFIGLIPVRFDPRFVFSLGFTATLLSQLSATRRKFPGGLHLFVEVLHLCLDIVRCFRRTRIAEGTLEAFYFAFCFFRLRKTAKYVDCSPF